MRHLRILHISDLHERAPFDGMPDGRRERLALDSQERGIVLGARFKESLVNIAKGGVDMVCFTGDVADWAHPDEYRAATKRVEAILAAVAVPKSHFFAVPGNHDVQRGIHPHAWAGVREWLARTRDPDLLGRWLRDASAPPYGVPGEWKEQLKARSSAFWTWLREFGRSELVPAPSTLGYRQSLRIAGIDSEIHVVGLDSAWLCGGDDDQGRIRVTEEQVLSHVRDGERALSGYRVALVHHPLDHLADHHQVRRLLADDGVDLLLHGHQHHPLALNLEEPGAAIQVFASGCLMEGDEGLKWPNGFQLIEIDTVGRRGHVHFRKWSRDGRFWANGSDLYRSAPDGTLQWPSSPLGHIDAAVAASLDGLSPAATNLLLEITARTQAESSLPLPHDFTRASRPGSSTDSRQLHGLLRELRARDLVRPLEGGKWEAGKHAVLTAVGSLAVRRLEQGPTRESGQAGNEGASEPRPEERRESHLREIRSWASATALRARELITETGERVRLSSSAISGEDPMEDAKSCYLWGWSGRGKTSALRMLALRALDSSVVRIPLLLNLSMSDTTLLTAAKRAARAAIPVSASDDDVSAWLANQPTLLIIDDWQNIRTSCRTRIEETWTELSNFPSRIVVAGTPGVRPPVVARTLQVPAFTHQERDATIEDAVGSDWGRKRYILDALPPGFAELLCEPVLLALFLDSIEYTRGAGMRFPQDLFALIHRFLRTKLGARHEHPDRRWDELSAICQALSTEPDPYSLAAITAAAAGSVPSGTSPLVAEDLCAVGIFNRIAGGVFAFSHELWRSYFRVSRSLASPQLSTASGVASWVGATDEAELRLDLPFVSGALSQNPALEDALQDALLSRSVELYLRALATRGVAQDTGSSESTHTTHLVRLHDGYFDLIKRHFPGISPWLDPWCRGDATEEASGLAPVTVGAMTNGALKYYRGFGPDGTKVLLMPFSSDFSEHAEYAPANGVCFHFEDLSLSRKRPGSGRLLAAESVFDQMEQILREHALPNVGWIARERLLVQSEAIAHLLEWPDAWRNWSVAACYERASEVDVATDAESTPADARLALRLNVLLEAAGALTRDGLGDTALHELTLPGPDRGIGGPDAFSPERRVARASAFFLAVADTYRRVCEECFPSARSCFLFAQFPCRAVVRVGAGDGVDEYWRVHWEVVAEWSMPPSVTLENARSPWAEDLWAAATAARHACATLGRQFVTFSASESGGHYWKFSAGVTEWVADLLLADIKRLRDTLRNAS